MVHLLGNSSPFYNVVLRFSLQKDGDADKPGLISIGPPLFFFPQALGSGVFSASSAKLFFLPV